MTCVPLYHVTHPHKSPIMILVIIIRNQVSERNQVMLSVRCFFSTYLYIRALVNIIRKRELAMSVIRSALGTRREYT